MAAHNTILEYLTTIKINGKGQLTFPKRFREDLGLGNGAAFTVLRLGDGLILLPEQKRFERLCHEVDSSLTHAGATQEEFLATLTEVRHRVYARHYDKNRAIGTLKRQPHNRRGK